MKIINTLNKRFIETITNVNRHDKIGIIVNHNWDVDIESVNGNQGSFCLILICNQKIDSG